MVTNIVWAALAGVFYQHLDTFDGFVVVVGVSLWIIYGLSFVIRKAIRMSRDQLYQRFFVFDAETGEGVPDCLVLVPQNDLAARMAIRYYASLIEDTKPGLADDLRNWMLELEADSNNEQ